MQGIDILRGTDLTPAQQDGWTALQAAGEDTASPFFSVGFMRAVAAERPDLRVAILSQDDRVTGILPFHRRGLGRGAPMAGPIADYQGLLGALPASLDTAGLLRACGLACFDFDHGLASDPVLRAGAFRTTASPRIDLRDGLAGWRAHRAGETKAIKTVERKLRKLAREVGPVRFVADDPDPAAWTTLLTWKRASLAAMRVPFILDRPWAMAVVDRIRATREAGFAGRLSTLYAGDRLVAAHFGMRSDRAWHWWFPTYDAQMSAYTPGLGLLLHCVEAAAQEGIDEIDLGRGRERYKGEFANAARQLCEGSLERAAHPLGAARRVRKGLHHGAEAVLSPRLVDFKRRAFNRALRAGRI